MSPNQREKTRWLWPVLWTLSIFATSSGVITQSQLANGVHAATGGHVSAEGFMQAWQVVWWLFVKGWHALEFGLLYLLIRKALPTKPQLAALVAVGYAFADEFHQMFVPSRGARLSDVTIDSIGVLIMWMCLEYRAFRRGQVIRYGSFFSRTWLFAATLAVLGSLIFYFSINPFGTMTLPSERAPAQDFRP